MTLTDEQRKRTTDNLEAFERYCVGDLNEVYERYQFNTRKKSPGELLDVFAADVRRLVRSCGYGAAESRIVLGINDDVTRRKLLGTKGLDLQKTLDACRTQEATARQFKAITETRSVNVVRGEPPPRRDQIQHRRQHDGAKHGNRRYETKGIRVNTGTAL